MPRLARPRFLSRQPEPEPAPEPSDGPSRQELEISQGAYPALASLGWILSRQAKRPIDAAGRPIPWYTYPAISFLGERVTERMNVFEFGCGQSTLWWANRAKRVTAVEHDENWASYLREQAPPNASVSHVALEEGGAYSRAALDSEEGPFHVIVIDGRDRVNCARNNLSALSDDGVILWDNSDRSKYRSGRGFLREEGFKQLPLVGMGPQVARIWETSIFYRPANCFGI